MRQTGQAEAGTQQPPPSRRWSLAAAFGIGALLGLVGGAVLGWLRYGAFEPAHFSSHILGGLFILGFAFLAIATIRNWLWRNPI